MSEGNAAQFCRDVARRIRQVRELRGLTQAQLAERSGLNRASIARIENGSAALSLDTLFKLSVSLGVRPDEFLNFVSLEGDFIIDLGESRRLQVIKN